MEATLQCGTLLKRITEAIKELCREVNITVDGLTGMRIQAMDSANVSLVFMVLEPGSFLSFECDRPFQLGVHLESLHKVLRLCGDDGELTLQHKGDDVLVIKNAHSKFDLKLLEIESDTMELPTVQYEKILEMPSGDMSRIFRDLREFGDVVGVHVDSEKMTFTVDGSIGSGSTDVPFTNVSVIENMAGNYIASYSLKYLSMFARASSTSSRVRICLSGEMPLSLRFEFDCHGYIQYFLAPQIDQ